MSRKTYTAMFLLLLLLMLLAGYYAYEKGAFGDLQPTSTTSNNKEEEEEKEGKEELNMLASEFKTEQGLSFFLTSPQPNSEVGCNFHIAGDMPNVWFFEGSFPVEVIVNDKVVYTTHAHTEKDWTFQGNLPFIADVNCKDKCIGSGLIMLKRSNPSALEENNDSYAIPVTFSKTCLVP